MDDALAALDADGGLAEVARYVRDLPAPEYSVLADEVGAQAAALRRRWPRLEPGWLPRTQDRIAVPLAGGRIVLEGVLDLVVGAPSRGQASVCVVDLRAGAGRAEHRADLQFHCLLETLRSGARPFRAATYYARDGALDTLDVTDGVLISALRRTVAGITELCRAPSERTP